jgi:leucyl aminopeptidase
LVNQGPHDIYPESLALMASQIGQAAGLDVEVWDERRLAEDRCGALLAVGSGSDRPPRIVRLRYRGGPKDAAPLALVGKGVTFDSGGLSIKPPESMTHMKYDMAGAAVVISAMQAISQLRLPVNVDGWIGLAENMINGRSYKLGDVLTARSGKTIEVLNTDAEGRLVLADVLDLAVTSGASRIVDLATLTGACVVALGRSVAGLMTNDQAWANAVMTAAARCGEPVWQLPMFDEFAEQIKSEVADIKNVGDSRWGGAITGAKFLEEFVQRRPWVHLDIAGPSFAEKPRAWIDAGASGAMVRTLVELAASIAPPTQSA